MITQRDKGSLVETRAINVMQSAINLLEFIEENYEEGEAIELERRILNGIRNRDTAKFSRTIKRISGNS
jgi:hypothetical protein